MKNQKDFSDGEATKLEWKEILGPGVADMEHVISQTREWTAEAQKVWFHSVVRSIPGGTLVGQVLDAFEAAII